MVAMNGKRLTDYSILFVLLIGLCPLLHSQGVQRKSEFERKIRSDNQDTQFEAIRILETYGDPSGVDLLVKTLFKIESKTEKIRAKYDKVGAKIRSEVAKRIDKRARDNRISQAAIEAAEKKIKPLRDEFAQLNTELENIEDLKERLVLAADSLMNSMNGEARSEAASKFVTFLSKQRKTPMRLVLLGVFGTVDHPLISASLAESVLLADPPAERVAALNALNDHKAKHAVGPAESALNDDYWQVRSAAIEVLKRCKSATSVGPLILRLGKEDGRLVTEIVEALIAITKQDFHDNVSLWQRWWESNKEGFDPETAEGAGSEQALSKKKSGSYFFGIQTKSKDIIYVLDVSGSMLWALDAPNYQPGGNVPFPRTARDGKRRYDYSKKQLLESIGALPNDGTFNIVYYNEEAFVWKKKMQVATAKNKAVARKWIEKIEPGGNTNIFDALERAFGMIGRGSHDKAYNLAADTIFFLSDGRAYRGRITEPGQMLREVRRMNSLKKVQIHSVSLGKSSDHNFMKSIAKQNGGQCVIKQ